MPLQGLPGGAEVWKVGDDWFAVYFVPDSDVPLMYRFERDDLREAAGATEADKTLTKAQAEARGAIEWGATSELDAQLGKHPWDSFLTRLERDVDIAPWLADPEVVAHVGSAWLRGTSPNLERTEWWQSRTDQERRWLEQAAANPEQARWDLADMRRQVSQMMQDAGATNITPEVANLIADNITRGHWSEEYGQQQMRRISDPYAQGDIDRSIRREMAQMGATQDRALIEAGDRAGLSARVHSLLASRLGENNIGLHFDGSQENPEDRIQRLVDDVLSSESPEAGLAKMEAIRRSVDGIAIEQGGQAGGFTTTREHEDVVRDMARRWLGPSHGDWSASEIAQWAGRIRNDPNAEQELEEHLRGLRMAAFPNWTNSDVTYEQIASITRGIFREQWGQTPDETDPLFLKLAGMTDHDQQSQVLRREGLQRGIAPVMQEASRGILQATGGDIRPAI